MKNTRSHLARVTLSALVALALAAPMTAHAKHLELIPSIDLSKGTDKNAGDAKISAGFAIRTSLAPMFKAEGLITYRQGSLSTNQDVHYRVWPVMVTAYFLPVPAVHVGAGVGWYRSTIDFNSNLPYTDITTSKFGEHIAGGVLIPFTPKLGLDVTGRYIFLQKDKDLHVVTEFNPDFWDVSAGLSFGF